MKRTALPVVLLAGVTLLAACGGGDPLASPGGDGGDAAGPVTVGSANFPENLLLGEIYATALEDAGVEVERKFNIGSREAIFPSLEQGDLDVVPEYTGSLLSFVAGGTVEAKELDEQLRALDEALPAGLTLLEPSAAEDKDVITCNRETAEKYGLESIGDLAPVAGELTIGAGPEFAERPIGVPGLKEVYGVEFGTFQPLDTAGPLTVEALKQNKVQCANLFSTQSAIGENGFVVLADPEGLVEAENVVPLVRDDVREEVSPVLDKISAALDTETLKDLVERVEAAQEDPREVAEDFLAGV